MTNPGTIEATLQRAVEAHRRSDLATADDLYREVLEQDPKQVDALHYLGVISMQRGNFVDAARIIGEAAELRPDDPMLRANLGNAFLQAGDHGVAAEHYGEALAIDPSLTEARRNRAIALLSLDRVDEALREITQAARTAPQSLELHVTMGNILHEAGRSDEAIACFQRVLSVRPDIAPVHRSLGNVLRQTGRMEEAITCLEKATSLAPGYADPHYDLGVVYRVLGDRDSAETSFRKALELDPHCCKAWRGFANLRKNALSDADLATIDTALQSAGLNEEQRMHLEFAAGKSREDRLDHARAFEHFERANALQRAAISYDRKRDEDVFRHIEEAFDESFFDRWSGAGPDDATPIFIVGMPRSGTSLVEQIIASHSKVFGAGELSALFEALASRLTLEHGFDYSTAVKNATAEDLSAISAHYLDSLRSLDREAARITDKLPTNFLNLGMISVLFPKATVIHCRRDARDTCYSIYKHYFSARGHNYAYDLEELGAYYNGYRKLMDHWARVLPIPVHTFDYEDIVGDVETAARSLLDACDLPWEAACLDFHKSRRPVATISADQVRRPIYSDSVGAWRRHEQKLAPLLRILNEYEQPG